MMSDNEKFALLMHNCLHTMKKYMYLYIHTYLYLYVEYVRLHILYILYFLCQFEQKRINRFKLPNQTMYSFYSILG